MPRPRPAHCRSVERSATAGAAIGYVGGLGGQVRAYADAIGYAGVAERTHVHDVQATILDRLVIDHERLTYSFQGWDFRLMDVAGEVVREIVA